jgi:hypothetical protein
MSGPVYSYYAFVVTSSYLKTIVSNPSPTFIALQLQRTASNSEILDRDKIFRAGIVDNELNKEWFTPCTIVPVRE